MENPLAKAVLSGEFTRGDTVRIDVRDDSLVFEKAEGRAPEGGAGIPAEVSV